MLIEPYNFGRVYVKSDATDGTGDVPLVGGVRASAFHVSASSDVTVVFDNGQSCLFTTVPAGIFPIQCKRIASTGTGAAAFVALYHI